MFLLYALTHTRKEKKKKENMTKEKHIHDQDTRLLAKDIFLLLHPFSDLVLYYFHPHARGYGCHRNHAYINWIFQVSFVQHSRLNSLYKRLLCDYAARIRV